MRPVSSLMRNLEFQIQQDQAAEGVAATVRCPNQRGIGTDAEGDEGTLTVRQTGNGYARYVLQR